MADRMMLEPVWSEAWPELAAKFGVRDRETLDVVMQAAFDALKRTIKKLPRTISLDSPIGMLLRRRCVKGLAIKASKSIAVSKQKLPQGSRSREFAINEVRRRLVHATGAESGEWFDPTYATFASPSEYGDDVPDWYRLTVLECVTAVICEQDEHFHKRHIDEVEVAKRVHAQRLHWTRARREARSDATSEGC